MTREEFEALLEEAYTIGFNDGSQSINQESLEEDVIDPFLYGYYNALLEAGVYNESVLDDAKNFIKDKTVRLKKRSKEEIEDFKKTSIYKKVASMVEKYGKKLPKLEPAFKKFLLTITKYVVELNVIGFVYKFILEKCIPGALAALNAGDAIGLSGQIMGTALVAPQAAAIAGISTIITAICGLIIAGATVVTIAKYIKNHKGFTVKKTAKQESSEEIRKYIVETNENVEEWLDSFDEAAMPSPKELAVKIYERVLKSGKVAKAFAKNPDKVDIIKKKIKHLAVSAAKTLDGLCKANKDNSKEIIKEVGLGVICSLIIAIVANIGPAVTVATITGASTLLNKAIKMAVVDKDVRKAVKFVKDSIGKKFFKQESSLFDLENDFDKYLTE